MFKWGRTKDKTHYEPKTPKMPSVSLPDERYTPIKSHIEYIEKPRATSFVRRLTQDYRGTTPMLDAWAPNPPVATGRARSRTISTPVYDVQAPRPIRPHPSQGGFIPVMEPNDRIRRDSSRGPMVPVGVPSAAFLEEQIRRSRNDTRTVPPSNRPIDMNDAEYDSDSGFLRSIDSKRLREAAKRNGVRVHTHPSKAYLENLNEQQRLENLAKESSGQSTKKKATQPRPRIDEQTGKPVWDFDDWKAVPLDLDLSYVPVYVDPKAPIKSVLKKAASFKPTAPKPPAPKPSLKSAMKKKESSPEVNPAYYSENESSRRRSRYESDHRMSSTRVVETPSKAFLEEQQEKLDRIRQKNLAASHQPQPAPARHEMRPTAFGHSSSTSTGSPTDSVVAPSYDQYGRPIRPRRSSGVDPATIQPRNYNASRPSNYIPPYIKGSLAFDRPKYGPKEYTYHGILTWPLVEYSLRKHDPYPLICFDAGFDPRDRKYSVKANRGMYSSPLTREEMDIPVVREVHLPEMWIINQKLSLWPIHLKNSNEMEPLRVIDVFRAIYDTYAQPLTPQELAHFGEDYIRRCQPAFARRCEDSPQFTHIEERRGLLRIDLLRGRRIFKGLIPMVGRPFQWELVFDDGR